MAVPLLAHAQTIGYNNVVTFLGQGFANGGSANQAGNTITRLVADDITLGTITTSNVLGFQFTVANFNAVNVTARPRIRFYDDNGTGGGPGTLLSGFTFNAITFTAGNVATFNVAAGSITPFTTDGTFWAGITFDDNTGATGATQAQLDLLGQGLFDPPTVGSSVDAFFQTTAAGSFFASNPTGSFFNFGGNPIANFGWQFTVTQVPEPGVATLLGVAAFGAVAIRRRPKRTPA
jgi:hypothetical protein